MKNFLKAILVVFLFLLGLEKLLIGCKHTQFISDLSEFPPHLGRHHRK